MTRALAITLGLGLVALLAVILLLNQCSETRNAETKAKLSTSQAGATIISGNDAVNTAGKRADADAAGETLTRKNADAIHHADGADAPVAAPVRDAGRASLCKRAAYRGKPECVLGPDPR